MAINNYKTVKGGIGLYVSNDRAMTQAEFDALFTGGTPADGGTLLLDAFVTNPEFRALAIVQSMSLAESGDTEEILDLADPNADWANPEVSKKSGTGSASVFQLKEDANGTISIDDSKFTMAPSLKLGDIVLIAKGEYPLVAGSKIERVFRAVITSNDAGNSPSESGSYDISFDSKGRIYRDCTIALT
jgi:hypothetical protein